MSKDRKILYASSIVLVLVLLGLFFIPGNIGRTMTALLLVVSAVAIFFFIKKRPVLSINKNAVLGIMFAMGAVCLALYYLTGAHFGYYKSSTLFSIGRLLSFAAIIGATEVIRYIFLAQNAKFMGVFAYLVGVLSELLLCDELARIERLSAFLDVMGLTLFPALIANFFYNYLSKRYGVAPSAVFRFMLALPTYLPIVPALDEAIYSFFLMIIPVFAWTFIDLLYEKKKKYASSRKGDAWSIVSLATMVVMMVTVIGLISGEFRYKLVVIATPSMTGSINEGDAIIYEEYDGRQVIEEDTVVVFTKNDRDLIIHRVVSVERRNGINYYTTKGDANDIADSGYITVENIRGIVLFRLPNMGQPSLFLRELFS